MPPFRPAVAALALAAFLSLPGAPSLAEGKPDAPAFDAQRSTTTHSLAVAGEPLAYAATAEFLPLRDAEKNEVEAKVFTIAYTRVDAASGKRPVTFLFNGGPGAASAYLHLGTAGPRVIRFGDGGETPAPPPRLIDNPDTWLGFTDLVFIDPVGTGFSRSLRPDDQSRRKPWSVDGDVRAIADVIRQWLTRNDRWGSPTFLAGESYGGYRVAALARELIRNPGLAINGAVLISPVIDFGTMRDDDTGVLAPAFRLPSYAASAAALGKTPGSPADAAQAAERYALTDYTAGLASLDVGRLDASRALFARVAALTGLPADLIERHRGRVSPGLFAREILRDRRAVVSIYDGTLSGFDPEPAAHANRDDPVLEGGKPAYATAYMSYVRGELKVTVEEEFRLLSGEVNGKWEWPRGSMPNAAGDLQAAMALAPEMRVLIAHGRTDLITPYFASVWLSRQIELPENGRDRLKVAVYEGGHMMYTRAAERARLAQDVRALIESSVR